MTDKKENAKRLGIYLLFIALSDIMFVFLRKSINNSQTAYFIFGHVFWCSSPAIASLITRAVTKEGFRDMKLHLHLKGNLRWYLLAFFLPMIGSSAMPIMGARGNIDVPSFTAILSTILQLAALTAVMSLDLLGEELGWRGYMNQKMEPLIGTAGTCLLGGIVWGLWHCPMDIDAYLSGAGSGSALMINCCERTLLLMCFGVFLMWLTKKTDSVFPAVLAHYMYNGTDAAMQMLLRAPQKGLALISLDSDQQN